MHGPRAAGHVEANPVAVELESSQVTVPGPGSQAANLLDPTRLELVGQRFEGMPPVAAGEDQDGTDQVSAGRTPGDIDRIGGGQVVEQIEDLDDEADSMASAILERRLAKVLLDHRLEMAMDLAAPGRTSSHVGHGGT